MTIDKFAKREYSIEPYDPEWINRFEGIKVLLKEIFKDKALTIEHVGSTSIPGMKAKPLIDVLVTVTKMESFLNERDAMTIRGYKNEDNCIEPDSILFTKKTETQRQKTYTCV